VRPVPLPGTGVIEAAALHANNGSHLSLERCTLSGGGGVGLAVLDGTEASIQASTVLHTQATATVAIAILADNAATLGVTDTAIVANAGQGISVQQASRADVQRTLIRDGSAVPISADYARAVQVAVGSSLVMTDSAVVDNVGAALAVLETSRAGPVSHARVERTLLAGTRPLANGTKGQGVALQFADAELLDTAVVSNHELGVVTYGACSLGVEHSAVLTTLQNDLRFGYGLGVSAGSTLKLLDSDINQNTGIGLVVAGGAVVRGCVFSQNTIALHVLNGSEVQLGPVFDGDPVPPNVLRVSDDTGFVENGSRLGDGNFPLPDPFSITRGF
jgi:hypothetical protein